MQKLHATFAHETMALNARISSPSFVSFSHCKNVSVGNQGASASVSGGHSVPFFHLRHTMPRPYTSIVVVTMHRSRV